jgi:hypothetical protein
MESYSFFLILVMSTGIYFLYRIIKSLKRMFVRIAIIAAVLTQVVRTTDFKSIDTSNPFTSFLFNNTMFQTVEDTFFENIPLTF